MNNTEQLVDKVKSERKEVFIAVDQSKPLMIAAKNRADYLASKHGIPQAYTKAYDPEQLVAEYQSDAQLFGLIPAEFWSEVNRIDNDARLSAEAKNTDKLAAQKMALEKADKYLSSRDFDAKITKLEAELVNRLVTARRNNSPKDEVAAYLQQSEMRAYIQRLRDEQSTKPLSKDKEDPALAILRHAVENYGPSMETAVGAILDPPWPVKVVGDEIKEAALTRLQAVVSPIQDEQVRFLRGYREVLVELHYGAREAILGRDPQAPLRTVH